MFSYQLWPMKIAERRCAEYCEVHGESSAVTLQLLNDREEGWMIAATFADGDVYMAEDVLLQRLGEYTDQHGLSAFGMLVEEKKGWVVAVQPGWYLCPTCNGEDSSECSACDMGWVPDEPRKGVSMAPFG